MKILVCISAVPDTTSKINFTDGDSRFDTQGVQFVINPNDEFGLTRAIWFQEQQQAEVHIATVGGAQVEPIMRKALAIGATKGYRIDAEPVDGFFVAEQLTALIKNESYDLIICGRESIDYNGAMVPGLIAHACGFAFINTCVHLETDGVLAKAIREIDGGNETLSTSLPLVIGAQKGLVEESDLKIPNMRGIMMARQKPIEVLPPVAVEARTADLKFERPKAKGEVTLVDANDLDTLIHLLHKEANVL
ncbi:MAG: electron transfer flavoprotein subunit beta [Bacteroidota bacterium]